MAELIFNLVNDAYVAEFEATADFNLHIERSKVSYVQISQKTAGENFAPVVDMPIDSKYNRVVDYDFAGVIYPKQVRVKTGVLPSVAIVTFAE